MPVPSPVSAIDRDLPLRPEDWSADLVLEPNPAPQAVQSASDLLLALASRLQLRVQLGKGMHLGFISLAQIGFRDAHCFDFKRTVRSLLV
jgi:hypothetical protein